MATGDRVGSIIAIAPPATTSAGVTMRAGGSTPNERVSMIAFQDATDEFMDYVVTIKGYSGLGFTVRIGWMSVAATTGDCAWRAAFRAFPDDAEDYDAAHTYDYNPAAGTVVPTASVAGEIVYDNITFTDGADSDSVGDNTTCILRITRDADHANDTLVGDAQIVSVVVYET